MTAGFPIIRLELDRMKCSIMLALAPALEAEKKNIEELIEKTIKTFDFGAEVKAIVYREIHEAIQASIRKAASDAFFAEETREHMAELVNAEVKFLLGLMVERTKRTEEGKV